MNTSIKAWLAQELKDKNVNIKLMKLNFWLKFYEIAKDDVSPILTNRALYKNEVMNLLDTYKKENRMSDGTVNMDCKKLQSLQLQIEDHTMYFDEACMYNTAPDLIKSLIKPEMESAKDYLYTNLQSKVDHDFISEFGHYTIEAIIVYVLCVLFSTPERSEKQVRVSSLIELLERAVRSHAKVVIERREIASAKKSGPLLKLEPVVEEEMKVDQEQEQEQEQEEKQEMKVNLEQEEVQEMKVDLEPKKKKEQLRVKVKRKSSLECDNKYPFGSMLVKFMKERDLIDYVAIDSESARAEKKGKSYYLSNPLYVVCKFDLALLPIKLNLPMVYPPLKWHSTLKYEKARSISDLRGGYLSNPSIEIFDRYKLLSSGNYNNFYISLKDPDTLCNVMNGLQSQPFQINKDWLNYLIKNRERFVKKGLLMPEFYVYMNIKEVSGKLRNLYMSDELMQKHCTYNELLLTLQKDIQRARYEQLILDMASCYEGYRFYLPAFLDFRGRIYRCGLLHFHERDFMRSLIEFVDAPGYDVLVNGAATSFHYQPFLSAESALYWINETYDDLKEKLTNKQFPLNDYLIDLSSKAKHPFQFLSHFRSLLNNKEDSLKNMPITQDASASAYQIMSYLLMDSTMAMNTNLIQSQTGEIQDIYTIILGKLKEFMRKELEDLSLSSLVCKELTRKIVKGIFMPMIYGKTVMSTASDIRCYFSRFLSNQESFVLAKLCFQFWKTRFHNMECLISLIRSIGWVTSSNGRPVMYDVDHFSTIQDYVKMDAYKIWVLDKMTKKRSLVTMRVASETRDSKKTEVSTFVNFIHQKDAYIAMKVVESMLYANLSTQFTTIL